MLVWSLCYKHHPSTFPLLCHGKLGCKYFEQIPSAIPECHEINWWCRKKSQTGSITQLLQLLIPLTFVCHMHILEQDQSWNVSRFLDHSDWCNLQLRFSAKQFGSRLRRPPVAAPAQREAISLHQDFPGSMQLNFNLKHFLSSHTNTALPCCKF